MSKTVPLLTHAADLKGLATELAGQPAIALDTEATGYHRYHERICLVQISTHDRTWLVDTLAFDQMEPIGRLMADPAMQVVIHDADYDLRLFKRNYGFRAAHVFDTFVAAELLNEDQLSLAGLLEKYAGEKLDKKFQKADWSRRPLPQAMLDYAAKDTSHLLALRDVLREKLVRMDRMAWAEEEFARLVHIPFENGNDDEPGFLKIKGAKALRPHQLAVLRELHAWREEVASRIDRAPFMVLGNDVMIGLARDPALDLRALAGRKGVGEAVLQRNGKRILEAIERGMACPKEQWPRVKRGLRHARDPEFDLRMDRLRAARERLMAEFALKPGIVCANHLLMEIARQKPGSPEELRRIEGMRDYQVTHFGRALLAAV